MRKLEKENIDLYNKLSVTAAVLDGLAQLDSIMGDTIIEHSKALGLMAKRNKEVRDGFVEFKNNVNRFITVVTQQITFLSGAQKIKSSNPFGPVKKSEKIKPD